MRSAAARAAASAALFVSVGEEHLTGGDERRLLEELDGALGRRIEEAERLHRVPEQLDADRPAVERTEDVDDAAAGRERAEVLDERGRLVPHLRESAEECVAVELLSDADHLAEPVEHVRREHPLVERAPAEHQRRKAGPLTEVEQRAQPLGDHGGIGRQLVPGEDLVARKLQDVGLDEGARPAEEEGEVRRQLLGRVLVRRDAHQRRPELAREPGEEVPTRRALEPGGADPGARPELRAHLSQRIGRGGDLRRGRRRRGVRLGHRGRGGFKTATSTGQPPRPLAGRIVPGTPATPGVGAESRCREGAREGARHLVTGEPVPGRCCPGRCQTPRSARTARRTDPS